MVNIYLTPNQMNIIEAYIDCNMVIQQTAEKLYFNRGTVVYHLGRIKTITGLDPRNVRDLWRLCQIAEDQRKRERSAEYD